MFSFPSSSGDGENLAVTPAVLDKRAESSDRFSDDQVLHLEGSVAEIDILRFLLPGLEGRKKEASVR
jgi:hypothetical protein